MSRSHVWRALYTWLVLFTCVAYLSEVAMQHVTKQGNTSTNKRCATATRILKTRSASRCDHAELNPELTRQLLNKIGLMMRCSLVTFVHAPCDYLVFDLFCVSWFFWILDTWALNIRLYSYLSTFQQAIEVSGFPMMIIAFMYRCRRNDVAFAFATVELFSIVLPFFQYWVALRWTAPLFSWFHQHC